MTTLFRSQSISIDKGSIIAGRYEVVDLVGTGGMGVVLRVIDRELNDEIVALKILHSHLAADKSVFRRFRNEVLVARSLTHPNIVRIHDIGRAEEGKYSYISMEYVDGESLKERLQSVNEDGDVQSLAEYRQKYRMYQTDKQLQELHSAHSWVTI